MCQTGSSVSLEVSTHNLAKSPKAHDVLSMALLYILCCYAQADGNRREWEQLPIENALFLQKLFMPAISTVLQSALVAGKTWYLLDSFCLRSSASAIQDCTRGIILL